jgi:hypothetical protein
VEETFLPGVIGRRLGLGVDRNHRGRVGGSSHRFGWQQGAQVVAVDGGLKSEKDSPLGSPREDKGDAATGGDRWPAKLVLSTANQR